MACALAPLPVFAEEERARFRDPKPFGPPHASFPWHACFSGDGRWIAIVSGYESRAAIFDLATRKEVWRSDPKQRRWTHRGVFSRDSNRFHTIGAGALVTVALQAGRWSVAARAPLGFETGLGNLAASPHPVSVSADGKEAVFLEEKRAWRVDLETGVVARATKDEDLFSAFLLRDGALAVSRLGTFTTHIRRAGRPPRETSGLLVEPSPDGSLWLVAPDRSRFDVRRRREDRLYRIYLQTREAGSGKVLGSVELHGRRQQEHNHRLLLHAAFSADATMLATVEGSGAIVLRDARTLVPIQTIDSYAKEQYAMGAALSPDGSRLLTGGRIQQAAGVLLWSR